MFILVYTCTFKTSCNKHRVIDVRNNHFTSVVSGSVHSDDTVYETRISVKRVSKHMHELMLVGTELNMNVETLCGILL